jgi:ABC-type Na+ efflux pump permease subunit
MDPWRRPYPRADLRAGDADRQAVVDELQRHYVEGRLSSEELSERVSQALAARTFGDLSTLLSDLPSVVQPGQEQLPPGHQRQPEQWHTNWLSPSIVLLLIMISVLAVLWMTSVSGGRGVVFPWPLLIWGFFFFRGGRRGRRF